MIVLYILSFLLLLFLSYQNRVHENFASRDKTELHIDPYNQYTIDDKSQLRPQLYLDYLHDTFPKTSGFRAAMLDKTKNHEIVHNAYGKDVCLSHAYNLCEMTDPIMRISQTKYPPKWLMNSSIGGDTPPTYNNLSCFESNYNCCKS